MAESEKVDVVAIVNLSYDQIYERGTKFKMLKADVERHLQAKHVVLHTVYEEEQAKIPVGGSTLEQLMEQWEYEMSPSDYLVKFPKGAHLELAQRLVELLPKTE